MKKSKVFKLLFTASLTVVVVALIGVFYNSMEAQATKATDEENAVVQQIASKAKKEATAISAMSSSTKPSATKAPASTATSTTQSAEETTQTTEEEPQTQASTEDVAQADTADATYESTEPAEEAPATQPATAQEPATPAPAATATPQKQENTLQPNTIYVAGSAIPYQNGGQGSGQSIIDSNPNGVASTWGGASVQSGNDGMNTHFIGHNVGAFSCLLGVNVGASIVITDGNGNATTYIVNERDVVDTHGVDTTTGQDLWDRITGAGGGERVTLQTCLSDTTRLILFAGKA
ncbi:Sortase family protein [Pilibacter termitis]|uniref:Sortase family protein n=1 Tax=Pilibacter termitis TaxID=263852 RepID=A0A1T4LF80_9ENTE|nr:sortase [Pilibacter termitis]SJZ53442.1 Sortase family protein [Pilibacter termitis]